MSGLPNAEAGLTQIGHEALLVASNPHMLVGVEEGYGRWAASYDSSPNPLLAREERYVMPLLPPLEHKEVLDVACGTGRWLQKLASRGPHRAVGVDVSSAMLQVADGKPAIRGRLTRADCLELPFRSGVFDFALCSFAVSHIDDLRSMARETARVMKSNAEFIITDLHPEAHARGWRTSFRDGPSAVEIEALPRNAETVMRAFHAAGFESLTSVSLCLGEAEEEIFRRAGKLHLFNDACRVPAVLVCRFRRLASKTRVGD